MVMGKAAVFVEPYHFEIRELPPLPVEPGGVRVKVTSADICGSDLHFWRGDMKPVTLGKAGPIILGHELTGTVDALGSGVSTDSMARPLKEGDRVAFPYFFPCRRCYNCLRGEFNHCPTPFRFRQGGSAPLRQAQGRHLEPPKGLCVDTTDSFVPGPLKSDEGGSWLQSYLLEVRQ